MKKTSKKENNSKENTVASTDVEKKEYVKSVEKQNPFTQDIDHLPFEELVALEGVLMQEINWLGEQCLDIRNQLSTLYHTRTGGKIAGYDVMKQSEIALNNKHNKLVSLCTKVHNKITNYILDKWTD